MDPVEDIDLSDEYIATLAGEEALARIHAIEREMLSRAIHVLADLTKKTPEDVIAHLSEGLDEHYCEAADSAQAAAIITGGIPAKALYVPERKLNL